MTAQSGQDVALQLRVKTTTEFKDGGLSLIRAAKLADLPLAGFIAYVPRVNPP